jgi:hypothetical protein
MNAGGRRLEHEALAGDVTVGYTWKDAFGSPRIGLGYTYASGDSNPTDKKNETFDLLFATNHKLYGVMDLWGLRNVHSSRLAASLKPFKKLAVAVEYHVLWLADAHDSFFPESGPARNANGSGRNPQFSNFAGSELDLVASCPLTPYADVQLGYGHFFVGDYIKQSASSVPANGGAVDADWLYLQMRLTF